MYKEDMAPLDRLNQAPAGGQNPVEDPAHTDKASLLNQLRIDRSEVEPAPDRRWIRAVFGLVVVAALGVAGWLIFGGSTAIPIRTAVAREFVSGQSNAGPSLLDASGYVVARRQATVSSKITGKVLEVLIEEGDHVKAGEIIARLDDANYRAAFEQAMAQVAQAEASLAAAQTAYHDAEPIYERNQKQHDAAVISAQAFDQARAAYDSARTALVVSQRAVETAQASQAIAQQNLEDTIVRSPFSGVVTEKAAQPGEIVSPMSAGGGFTRTGIGTIVDMDSLEVEVDVSENFINLVRANQPVTVKLNAYPDWEIPGTVIATIPTADRAKATVKVRIALGRKDARIIPEMGARVSFLSETDPGKAQTAASQPSVVIPNDAVQGDGDTGVVFLVRGKEVERRAVRLGARTDQGQVVLAGLDAGSVIAAGDVSRLSDHAKVQILKD
jgi:RND family efflux transporter MFP subunit